MRGDITAVENHAAALRHLALQRDHLLAHGRQRRDLRDDVTDLRRTDGRTDVLAVDEHRRLAVGILQVHIDIRHDGIDEFVRHRLVLLERQPGHGAVHSARVDIGVAELFRCKLRHRALARPCGAVDCHY